MQRQIFNIIENLTSKDEAEKTLLSIAGTLEFSHVTDLYSQELYSDIFDAIKILKDCKSIEEFIFKIRDI